MGPYLGLNVFCKKVFSKTFSKHEQYCPKLGVSRKKSSLLKRALPPLIWGILEVGSYKLTHCHLPLTLHHIVTHARDSHTVLRYSSSTTVWEWKVNIVIKYTIYFMSSWTHIIEQSLDGSPFIPYSSAKTSL